jgi:putative flippase GtrA
MMDKTIRMERRPGAPLGELGRYTVVGGIAFVVDCSVLYGLTALGVNYILANTASFALANVVNFLLGHYYVFETRGQDLRSAYFAVLGISIAGLLLNDLVLYLFVEHLRLDVMAAKVGATILCLFFNFFARKALVYKELA